ncbi:MAG: isoprenyl transferase [Syntrophomonadaceae bacterium]|nr:isoprenyl transferase [Syntrophomonadaceae bacterium]
MLERDGAMGQQRAFTERPEAGLPRHIAIIMDGNGRWAKKRRLPRTMGHRAGMNALEEIVRACNDMGVQVLTVYAFSTENWKRPADEVSFLMQLLLEYMKKKLRELHEEKVKIRLLGDSEGIPEPQREAIAEAVALTADNTGLILNIALNYGARREILRACQMVAQRVRAGELKPEDITEADVEAQLFTAGLPDPDLLIRTGGEMRVSNYLLWQIAYAEVVVTDVLWPDFGRPQLLAAVDEYWRRDRRFGGLGKN